MFDSKIGIDVFLREVGEKLDSFALHIKPITPFFIHFDSLLGIAA